MFPGEIPAGFASRKQTILAALDASAAQHSDRSPKGSVDEAIRDFIDEINVLDGLVTTSSCAGRVSVFVDGPMPVRDGDRSAHQRTTASKWMSSGGKGGGHWLYVSHDPVEVIDNINNINNNNNNNNNNNSHNEKRKHSLHRLFGLLPGDGQPPSSSRIRLVHFRFEPMVSP
jgi:tRNA wybutosine-synthesizing protein 3